MSTWLRQRYPDDISRVLLLRLCGAQVTQTNVSYRPANLLAVCLVFAILLVVCTTTSIEYQDPLRAFTRFFPWCLYFLIVAASTLRLSHRLTQGFLHITVPLDHALTSHGRRDYEHWASFALSIPLQLSAGITLA